MAGKTNPAPHGVLYSKLIWNLRKKAINRKIKFRDASHLCGWMFHLSKKETWKVLHELENLGYIRIVPFHYIEIMQEMGV